MQIRRLLLLLICFFHLSLLARASSKPLVEFSVYEDHKASLNVSEIKQHYLHGQFEPLTAPAFNPGYTESVFWVAIKVTALPDLEKWVLAIDNPHINILEWYQTGQNGNIRLLYRTGDFLPFKQRPFPEFTSYAMPLEVIDGVYLLKIDKQKESLQVPMRVLTYNELAETYIKGNLISGLLTGTILMMIFFSLVLWVSTYKQLYLYYGLYIGALLLWIWSNKGLGFEYLWPNSHFFPSRARPTTLLFNIAFSIQFMQLFIGQTKKSYLYYPCKVLQIVCIVFLALILFPIDYQKSVVTIRYAQNILTVISTGQIIVVVSSLIEKIWQGVKEAKFYLAAILVLALSGIAEQLYAYGSIMLNFYVAQFALLGGLTIEAAILIYGLAQKFNRYRKDREKLLFEKSEQQKVLTATIVNVQEKERRIFAERLHDEIGAMLSVIGIHLNTLKKNSPLALFDQQGKLEQADEMLLQVANTVRSMSHQMSPVTIEKLGFVKALESLVQTINKTEKLYIELVCIGFESTNVYPPNYLNSIYRIIQELLQNMIKHAEASNGIIQLIEHDDMIVIMAEDNGKGLTPNLMHNPQGSGLNSILSKVDYLQGKIEIETPGSGTLINIEIPNQSITSRPHE